MVAQNVILFPNTSPIRRSNLKVTLANNKRKWHRKITFFFLTSFASCSLYEQRQITARIPLCPLKQDIPACRLLNFQARIYAYLWQLQLLKEIIQAQKINKSSVILHNILLAHWLCWSTLIWTGLADDVQQHAEITVPRGECHTNASSHVSGASSSMVPHLLLWLVAFINNFPIALSNLHSKGKQSKEP